MNKIYNYLAIVPAIFLLFAATSCEETNYMRFDSSDNGIYFTKDTLTYSFGVVLDDVRTHDFKVPVRVMGGLCSEARPVKFRVVSNLTTESEKVKVARENVHYRIKEALIFPDSIDGHILVEILRDNLEGDDKNGYTKYELYLELQANEYFAPTLDSTRHIRKLTFDNSVAPPDWHNDFGDRIWSLETYGEWHPLKYKMLVKYFRDLETVLPETYKKILADYGEYLENIPYGYPNDYRTIFVKYMWGPMYEYFSDEANKESILSQYPDFPFDFPNPYDK